jgi:cyclophilin family peptidyl-prolyl cis-trans isomerase
MPSAKRERQRANRALGQEQARVARRVERRKRSAKWTGVLIGGLVALAVLLAFLVSRGDDDGDSVSTDASATSGATTATSAPGTTEGTARTVGDPAVDDITCNDTVPAPNPARPTFTAPPEMTIDPAHTYVATLTTSCGDIEVTLDATDAPNTVNSFVFLIRQGFYDGLTFHRAVPDFVIQGGDPEGTGGGGPGYEFADENIDAPYAQGSLAMANSGPNTNGSQFFICTGTQPNCGLTQAYNNFGTVSEGLEVARKIEAFSAADGPPTRTIYILSATVTETDADGALVPEPTTTAAGDTATTAVGAGDTTTTTQADSTTSSS